MIRIVICDDEEIFTNKIQQSVRAFFSRRNINVAIKCFNESTSLISDIQNQTNLFLLDVMMPGNSGLELASVIRDVHPDAYIIFISNMEDAVFSSFKYAPLRFIRKEFIDEELPEALSAFASEFDSPENVINVYSDKKNIVLPIKSITFVESDKHYIHIYTHSDEYSIRGKLSDFEEIFSYEVNAP